jgi:hypothetical protein
MPSIVAIMLDTPRPRSPRLTRRVGGYIGDVLKWAAQMTLSAGVIAPLLVERNAGVWALTTLLTAVAFMGMGVVVVYLSDESRHDG